MNDNYSDEYYPDLGKWVLRVDQTLNSLAPELHVPDLGPLEPELARGVPTDPMQRASWSSGQRSASARYEHRPSDDPRNFEHTVRVTFQGQNDNDIVRVYSMNGGRRGQSCG